MNIYNSIVKENEILKAKLLEVTQDRDFAVRMAEELSIRCEELYSDIEEASEEVLDTDKNKIIVNTLFAFGGFLTSLKTPQVFSAYNDASPMVDLIRVFAEREGVDLDGE